MSKANIDVDLRLFAAAMICASTEETRFYLRGVYVEPHPKGGAVLTATDGKRLIVVHDKTGKCRTPAIVSTDKTIRSAIRRAKSGRLIVSGDGLVSIPDFYRSEESGLVDGIFPDWRKLMRKIRDTARRSQSGAATFNAGYLADFEKIAKLLVPGTKLPRIRVIGFPMDAALVLFGDCDTAFAVLMPMHDMTELNGLPRFMKPLLEGKRK